ncbi:hypothetical protein QUB63_12090 [Microcoleus sp. ARI1-B5]
MPSSYFVLQGHLLTCCTHYRSHNRYPVTIAQSLEKAIAHNNSSPKI